MSPGDQVTWDSQRGPVQATLVKYLEATDTWSVQIQNGLKTTFAIAKPHHLRTPS